MYIILVAMIILVPMTQSIYFSPHPRVFNVHYFIAVLNCSIVSPTGSIPAQDKCEINKVPLAGVSCGFSRGIPVFVQPSY